MKIELKELLEVHTELSLKEKLNNIDIKKELEAKSKELNQSELGYDNLSKHIQFQNKDLEASNKEIEILKHSLFASENTISNYDIFTKTINEIIADSKSSSLKSKLLCEIEEYNLEDMIFDSEIKEK